MSGLYDKYEVKRTDGKDAPGEKHEGCEYFVLDLTHDPFALKAIATYAMACRDECPVLSQGLMHYFIENGDGMIPSFFNTIEDLESQLAEWKERAEAAEKVMAWMQKLASQSTDSNGRSVREIDEQRLLSKEQVALMQEHFQNIKEPKT